LNDEAGDEPAFNLSLCDLLYEDGDYDGVVLAASNVEGDSDAGLACLHLKAKALGKQGLLDGATEVLSACLKRTAKRDPDLLRDIRYERALLYEQAGQASRAKKDLEKLYAEEPGYADVRERLGLSA
jgi:hypothetical protein